MKCPIDQTELKMTDRQGVEIDYCPTCRGVWLDRGELDKIIDRSVASDRDDDDDDVDARKDRRYGHEESGTYEKRYARPKKKRRSFLSELFDFE
jgi:Zn-finger nucleic acid-binding protein